MSPAGNSSTVVTFIDLACFVLAVPVLGMGRGLWIGLLLLLSCLSFTFSSDELAFVGLGDALGIPFPVGPSAPRDISAAGP